MEQVLDEDAALFYSMISDATNLALEPSKDRIVITKPTIGSRSAQNHILMCVVNDTRYVVLKRCVDNPEYIRREVAVGDARKVIGFPHYKAIPTLGIKLRNAETKTDCQLTMGWGNKPAVVIDFGNLLQARNLSELNPGDIKDISIFLQSYGRWAAFNYLLTVRDRSGNNFVFFLDSQILMSVDNEDGPFQSDGNYAGQDDVVINTHQVIEKFLAGRERIACVELLRRGFVEGWAAIKSSVLSLTMFSQKEIALLQELLTGDPKLVSEKIFY